MPVAETYELINSQTLGSATNSVSFTSYPSTYTDLVVIANCKYNGTSGGGAGDFNIQLNGDTAATYNYGRMVTTDTVTSGRVASSTIINNADAAYFSTFRANIFNYSGTSYYKHVLITGGGGGPTGVNQSLSIGVWRNTAAVTSIQVRAETGAATWEAGSTFSLYGITRA